MHQGTRYPPEILSEDEVGALLAACGNDPRGTRSRALIAVLYRGGLRINEALALYPKDVDFATGAVRVLHGKGDRARTIGLDPGALELLKRWLAVRSKFGIERRNPVFCSLDGSALGDGYLRRVLPDLATKAGIDKRVHAHGLRHTHAAELRTEGVDIGIISKQLGHRSISTTAHYLDHIAPHSVLTAIQKRRWSSPESMPC
jgi:site-specific recombinase XerD